ncbi:DegT/DnrJ/EryC1/StrS family aminotransferase [Aliiroseovarius sp. 2305UL8-7]|uniref:DegT/DnrJ/EryC1/StrS family aminotransferase n=1 Tax=Aliiroseovarius conchicola TaxID=3121637 RepID=UPI003527EA55
MTERARLLLECGDEMPAIRPLLSRDPNGGAFALFAGRRVKYSFNTRTAIREACDILRLVPGDQVLVPAYNCGSELDPLLDAGLDLQFYQVDRTTRPDLDDLERKITPATKAIYLIHYFGMLQPDAHAIRALCEKNGLYLIEDCALSLLSGEVPAEGLAGDISLFCFYKLLPVVAGGAIVLNSDRLEFDAEFDAAPPRSLVMKPYLRLALQTVLGARNIRKIAMKRRRVSNDVPREPSTSEPDMPVGYYFDPALRRSRLSSYTKKALVGFDVMNVREKRRENFATYQRMLKDEPGLVPLFPELPSTDCPLSYPVLVNDRDGLARKLSVLGIAATPWWSGYNQKLDWGGFADARYLKDHILALPCGQHLNETHITLISDEVKRGLSAVAQI